MKLCLFLSRLWLRVHHPIEKFGNCTCCKVYRNNEQPNFWLELLIYNEITKTPRFHGAFKGLKSFPHHCVTTTESALFEYQGATSSMRINIHPWSQADKEVTEMQRQEIDYSFLLLFLISISTSANEFDSLRRFTDSSLLSVQKSQSICKCEIVRGTRRKIVLLK